MFELRWEPGGAAVHGHERVGLDGLMAQRGRRARWCRMPGSAVRGGRGIRWPRAEQRDTTWWPQGIDLQNGTAIVSWHHPVDGADTDARVTFLTLGPRPRFWHVGLVDAELRPIAIHAGGLAWHDDRLWVADTFGGMRHFDTRDILRVDGRYVLPQSGGYRSLPVDGERAMRYSFLSFDGSHLVAGEYRNGTDDARLLQLELDGGVAVVHPGLDRMQGACVVDGTWYVTTSNGSRRNGDLWVGHPPDLVRREGALPPGPEDLAQEPGLRRLWSVSEHPGARWVFALDV